MLEPTIYLSTNNATITEQFVDCALTEARRVATLAVCARVCARACASASACAHRPFSHSWFPKYKLTSPRGRQKPLRHGVRMPIFPYAEILWEAEWGDAARSQCVLLSASLCVLAAHLAVVRNKHLALMVCLISPIQRRTHTPVTQSLCVSTDLTAIRNPDSFAGTGT